MNRRTYSNVLKILSALIVAYLIYAFIALKINMNKLNTIENSFVFQLNSIMNISKDRITQEYTTYNKDNLLEFDCIIDSSYFLSLVKVGELENTFDSGLIFMNKHFFNGRNGWFNHSFVFATTPNMARSFIPYYDVSILPMRVVNNVEMYVDGDIISMQYINNNIIVYSVRALGASFSFNEFHKRDLEYAYIPTDIDNLSVTDIFFCRDKANNLYIGTFSTMKGTPKTLQEIFDD